MGKNKKKRPVGRPPKFESPEQMQAMVDAYFKSCDGHPLTDQYGEILYDKNGQPIIVGMKPPTITGLALALGFSSRMSLLNYEAKKDFLDTVLRAKSRVEEYAETRLFDKDGANGAKFSLANNFDGWSEKKTVEQSTELTGKDGGPIETASAVQIYVPDNGRGKDNDNFDDLKV